MDTGGRGRGGLGVCEVRRPSLCASVTSGQYTQRVVYVVGRGGPTWLAGHTWLAEPFGVVHGGRVRKKKN